MDGCCIFFKKNRLKLLETDNVEFQQFALRRHEMFRTESGPMGFVFILIYFSFFSPFSFFPPLFSFSSLSSFKLFSFFSGYERLLSKDNISVFALLEFIDGKKGERNRSALFLLFFPPPPSSLYCCSFLPLSSPSYPFLFSLDLLCVMFIFTGILNIRTLK